MADVKIILPDGSAKEYAAGTTLGEAVKKNWLSVLLSIKVSTMISIWNIL